MAGSETVDPDALRAIARALESRLSPLFDKAMTAFEQAEIGGPAFSLYGAELAVTYPGMQHFAMRDLETKAQAVQSIIDRLNHTADTWHASDAASTARVS